MTQNEVDFFDQLAPHWDADEVRSTPDRINHILDLLPIGKGDSVLDLGTGTGVLLPYLAERVGTEGKVVGVDLSEGMLSRARQKFGDLENVDLLLMDFEEENLPGEYDLVMLYSVYPHLHFPKETIEWLVRMNMKKGGHIVIAFPSDEKFINSIHHDRGSDSDHLMPAPQLAGVIRQWGYDVSVASDTPDAYILIISTSSDTEGSAQS